MGVFGFHLAKYASRDQEQVTMRSKHVSWHSVTFRRLEHTLLIKSFASGLTKEGTVMSARAIRLCVMTGVSSNGASPTKNS